jgi:thiosulfate dehydrogenase [quinone] large subunit
MQRFQTGALVALRMLIGWHFLYEGLAKLTNPYWTSAPYLADSKGWFGPLFEGLAASPAAVTVIDALNAWGLTFIGLGLLLGLLARPAIIAGIVVLALYWLAAPPFPGLEYAMPAEGSYLIVNKVLIELAALVVLLAFPTSRQYGLDRLVFGVETDLEPTEEVHA